MGSPSRPSGDIYRRYGPTCLRVSYLPDDCRPKDLRRLFEKFGQIKNIYLPKNYNGREPPGFGFVHFVDPYDAAEARDRTDCRFLLGRLLRVDFGEEDRGDTRSREHRGKYLNLKFLKLIDGLTWDAVFCLLKRCPSLVNLHVSKLDRLPRMTRESTPQCMLDTLKAVKITDCGGPDSPEFLFAKYVLEHSVYLKKLIISCGPNMQEDTENLLRSELVEHARADGCKVYLSTRYAFEEC